MIVNDLTSTQPRSKIPSSLDGNLPYALAIFGGVVLFFFFFPPSLLAFRNCCPSSVMGGIPRTKIHRGQLPPLDPGWFGLCFVGTHFESVFWKTLTKPYHGHHFKIVLSFSPCRGVIEKKLQF